MLTAVSLLAAMLCGQCEEAVSRFLGTEEAISYSDSASVSAHGWRWRGCGRTWESGILW